MQEEEKKDKYPYHTDTFSRFTITLSREVSDELEARAKADKRAKAYYIEEALKAYFHPESSKSQTDIIQAELSPGVNEISDNLSKIFEILDSYKSTLNQFSDKIESHSSQLSAINQNESFISSLESTIKEISDTSATQYQEVQNSLNQISEKIESHQVQIDILSQGSKKGSSPKKKNDSEMIEHIQSIDEIPTDGLFTTAEASSIIERLSGKPLSSNAIVMRCNRAKDSNDIGYKEDMSWKVKGSWLHQYIKENPKQENILPISE